MVLENYWLSVKIVVTELPWYDGVTGDTGVERATGGASTDAPDRIRKTMTVEWVVRVTEVSDGGVAL